MSSATYLMSDGRIGPAGYLRHVGALTRRNLMRIKADPESMLDAVLVPIIFTVLFVYVFGGAVSGSQQDYKQYMIPGLLGTTGLNLAMAVGTGLNTDFQTGVMDRFRTLPIARSSVLVGKLAAEVCRGLVSFTVLIGFSLILGLQLRTGSLGVLAAVGLSLLFGMSMVWISMLLGLVMRSAQAVQGVSMVVIMPLQFGSSIFAPTSTMPAWLRAFTRYNPLSNLADACRSLINGGPLAHSVTMVLIWSVGITAITAPLAVAQFRKKA
ncbi:oleandomycin transport system permease protein [Kitasatospora sp. MAP12-15]|uniref:ABC transporter permease n=1 Tax=unclassified Kitasatospora TaxID=2633591 RepID=UPI0024770EB7|nr:ABC transporter permease [Kitasatospora sp. MAP12-44]MDH6110157.1 oleandomycin transport system permease protein [Kitasatospora sp. MAP12-44]